MSKNQLDYVFCPFCARYLETRPEEGKLRKYCSECKWKHYPKPDIAIAAVITDVRQYYQPCVLMVKRKREPFVDTWMFPAGFLEYGEHPEETLIREISEETGLLVVSFNFLRIQKVTEEEDPRHPNHLLHLYHVNKTEGDVVNNDPDENLEVGWKSVNDKVEIGFPHHIEIFDEIRSRIIDYFNYDFKI